MRDSAVVNALTHPGLEALATCRLQRAQWSRGSLSSSSASCLIPSKCPACPAACPGDADWPMTWRNCRTEPGPALPSFLEPVRSPLSSRPMSTLDQPLLVALMNPCRTLLCYERSRTNLWQRGYHPSMLVLSPFHGATSIRGYDEKTTENHEQSLMTREVVNSAPTSDNRKRVVPSSLAARPARVLDIALPNE